MHGNNITYKSTDTTSSNNDAVNFLTELLNSLDLPKLLSYQLHLKL